MLTYYTYMLLCFFLTGNIYMLLYVYMLRPPHGHLKEQSNLCQAEEEVRVQRVLKGKQQPRCDTTGRTEEGG